ncbi:hypothetical protein PPL_01512 [Heterostelium album PN500]|uniref:Uncharacterized protein n=1 Tax=Heterostelium pallidum (strain ATCC 26659 / Pp 5 / PN500) TaxID=670386 RepID=D3AZH0_HETP5|nr:hypothetical protein PPL_01512 [Heterostelium album PN500]EFA85553.1 hypothetical protein PPL_01512 [Heterostelium album PN500]|eukprot:XP_020437661.1 hypothetical protein PPL_01512 [Heterostelium album PN500]
MFGDGTHYKLENTVKRAVTHYTKLIDANYHKLNFTIANSISQGVTVDCSALTRKFKSDWNLNPSNYVPPLYTVVHQHATTRHQDRLIAWFFTSVPDAKANFTALMSLDRSCFQWNDGGLNLWDLSLRSTAFKIWVFNRFLLLSRSNSFGYFKTWSSMLDCAKKFTNPTSSPSFKLFHSSWMEFRNNNF